MFEASNKKNWKKIVTIHQDIFDAKLKAGKGIVQLRMQGVDALETHYSPSPVGGPSKLKTKKRRGTEKPKMGKFRQPKKFGDLAIDKMMGMFGVKTMNWGRSGWGGSYVKNIDIRKSRKTTNYKTKHKEPLEGYIVVNDVERKGRPVSWVFAGKTSVRDGSKLSVTKLKGMLKKSANYKLLADGLVYPYFFFTLQAKLRDVLMDGVLKAQKKKLNIWMDDRTAKGLTMNRFSQITGEDIIFPYLFRRMIKHQYLRMMEGYWNALEKRKNYKPKSDALFLDTFFDDTNPYVFVIDERDFRRLDSIVQITKNKIKMTTHPGNIVFLG